MIYSAPIVFILFGIISLKCLFILAKNPKNDTAFLGGILSLAMASAPTMGEGRGYPPIAIFVSAMIVSFMAARYHKPLKASN